MKNIKRFLKGNFSQGKILYVAHVTERDILFVKH